MALVISRQKVTLTIATGATTSNATISSVDTANTVIFYGGFRTDNTGTAAREYRARLSLVNSTTVRATRTTASASFTTTVECMVVEFDPTFVRSIQYGTCNLSAASTAPDADGVDGGTIQRTSLSSIDLNNSFVLVLGSVTGSTIQNPGQQLGMLRLGNSVVTGGPAIFGERAANGIAVNLAFVVVELQSGIIKQVQQVRTDLTGTSATGTQVISAVTLQNAVCVYNGQSAATLSNYNDALIYTALTDETTLTYTRLGTGNIARSVANTVIEFVANILVNNQRVTDSFIGTVSTATINEVDDTVAILTYNGHATQSAGASPDSLFASTKLASATTVVSEKVTGGAGLGTTTAATVFQFATSLPSRGGKILRSRLKKKRTLTESALELVETPAVEVLTLNRFTSLAVVILRKRRLKF